MDRTIKWLPENKKIFEREKWRPLIARYEWQLMRKRQRDGRREILEKRDSRLGCRNQMKDKILGSKAGETSLKESRERISRFLRRVEYEFSKRSPSEEKSIDWLTFGYFISFYSHSFEEQTNYLGNIREFTFFFLFFFLNCY